jgi:hypothetical protein
MSTIVEDTPENVEPLSFGQWTTVERLLHTAYISEGKRNEIEKDMGGFTREEATACIEYLTMNQPADFVKELGNQAKRVTT